MIVNINGSDYSFERQVTLEDILETMQFGMNVAVWVNGKQILKQNYTTCQVEDGNQIVIIKPLGGG